MNFEMWTGRHVEYTALHDGVDKEDTAPRYPKRSRGDNLKIFLILLVAMITSGGISYFIGREHGAYEARMDWLTPAGLVDHTFHYHRNFASEPTNETEHTWDVMFPRGRGFVQHPVLAPEPMGLAVYHQVHCLDAIRRAYYKARSGQPSDNHTAPGHVRHCVDYIRQALLCNADTNLEPIDPVLGGVVGFNVSRKCRDPVKLLRWADKWRTHNETSIL